MIRILNTSTASVVNICNNFQRNEKLQNNNFIIHNIIYYIKLHTTALKQDLYVFMYFIYLNFDNLLCIYFINLKKKREKKKKKIPL